MIDKSSVEFTQRWYAKYYPDKGKDAMSSFRPTPVHKMARRRDPSTSHAAARKAVSSVTSQHTQILTLMQDRNPRSTEEIELILGFDIHRRISELHEGELIRFHSETQNLNGYKANRYEITPKGINHG